jgi:hypothetical protein
VATSGNSLSLAFLETHVIHLDAITLLDIPQIFGGFTSLFYIGSVIIFGVLQEGIQLPTDQ